MFCCVWFFILFFVYFLNSFLRFYLFSDVGCIILLRNNCSVGFIFNNGGVATGIFISFVIFGAFVGSVFIVATLVGIVGSVIF